MLPADINKYFRRKMLFKGAFLTLPLKKAFVFHYSLLKALAQTGFNGFNYIYSVCLKV